MLLRTIVLLIIISRVVVGQDPVTGAFEGTVVDSRTGNPIAGAIVQFTNLVTEIPIAKRTDSQGRFYQGLLQPGVYRILVSAPGYKTKVTEQRLLATRGNTVGPNPFMLDKGSKYSPVFGAFEPFLETWAGPEQWVLPPTWKLGLRRIIAAGQGIATPQLAQFRKYADFQLFTEVKLTNETAVSIVVRYIDRNNYYLIQLTGAKAEVPFSLQGFVIKDGLRLPLGQVSAKLLAEVVNPTRFFNVMIKMTGSTIDVFVEKDRSGSSQLIGSLIDQHNTFSSGAVGLAVMNHEQYEAGRLVLSFYRSRTSDARANTAHFSSLSLR